jgi:hypothetical protein
MFFMGDKFLNQGLLADATDHSTDIPFKSATERSIVSLWIRGRENVTISCCPHGPLEKL